MARVAVVCVAVVCVAVPAFRPEVLPAWLDLATVPAGGGAVALAAVG
ncbi:MAG: hypothetical protein M3Z00_01950 [Actinomycetota bacterium]|nr:hypothetical protein [Actinomycetota bacterium]